MCNSNSYSRPKNLLTFLTLRCLLSVLFQLKENGLSFYCSWWIPMAMWLKANFWSYFCVHVWQILLCCFLSLSLFFSSLCVLYFIPHEKSKWACSLCKTFTRFMSLSVVASFDIRNISCGVSQKWPFVIQDESGFFLTEAFIFNIKNFIHSVYIFCGKWPNVIVKTKRSRQGKNCNPDRGRFLDELPQKRHFVCVSAAMNFNLWTIKSIFEILLLFKYFIRCNSLKLIQVWPVWAKNTQTIQWEILFEITQNHLNTSSSYRYFSIALFLFICSHSIQWCAHDN